MFASNLVVYFTTGIELKIPNLYSIYISPDWRLN